MGNHWFSRRVRAQPGLCRPFPGLQRAGIPLLPSSLPLLLKAIPAGVMVGLGGLAGWLAVADISAGALTFFALLTVWEITGRNLSNDLADAKTDRHLGIATLATTHGPQTSIRWIFAGALVMPALAAIQPGGPLLRLSLAAAAIVLMTVPAWRLMRAQSVSLALPYFNRASLFPVIGLVAALLTPSLT